MIRNIAKYIFLQSFGDTETNLKLIYDHNKNAKIHLNWKVLQPFRHFLIKPRFQNYQVQLSIIKYSMRIR